MGMVTYIFTVYILVLKIKKKIVWMEAKSLSSSYLYTENCDQSFTLYFFDTAPGREHSGKVSKNCSENFISDESP